MSTLRAKQGRRLSWRFCGGGQGRGFSVLRVLREANGEGGG